jgi:hypothetical protein
MTCTLPRLRRSGWMPACAGGMTKGACAGRTLGGHPHRVPDTRHDTGGDSRYNRSMITSSPRAYATVKSPVGPLLLAGDDQGLRLVNFQTGRSRITPDRSWKLDERHFANVIGQLEAYFAGELRSFHLRLAPEGTPFQLAVWNAC